MPSVFTSMNMASRGTLEDIVKQRIVEAELAKQQMAQMRQMGMDAFNMNMRVQGHNLAKKKYDDDVAAAKTKAEQDATKRDAEIREKRNKAGAADMFFEGLARGEGDSPAMRRTAFEGGVGASNIPRVEKPEPTLEQIRAKAEAQAKGSAQGRTSVLGTKPTKVKIEKDDAGLPRAFRQAISNRAGKMAGFKSAKEAFESITSPAKWPEWRRNYPGLDRSKVKSELENIYGESISSGNQVYILSNDEAQGLANQRAADAKNLRK
jgi:hypothetical protein